MSRVWEMSSMADGSEERIGPVSLVLRARWTESMVVVIVVVVVLGILGGGSDSALGVEGGTLTKLLEMCVTSLAGSSSWGRVRLCRPLGGRGVTGITVDIDLA